MTRNLRVFFVGGAIAYRGLFNWIHPAIYIPTMLGAPLFQLIFFTKLGQYAQAESRDFYIVGNSVQVCAMSSVYGMTMAIANERQFQTLGPLLATPANRAAVFLGRGIPVLAIRHAALGGEVWRPLGMVIALGIACFVISTLTFRYFERAARDRATLSLT